MSQCLFCENSLEMYCQECQETYCHHCGIMKHLRNNLIQPHVINYLCEECEEEVSTTHCKSCEQNLCPGCDTKIHNKGKRAQHTREPISNCLCMKDIKLVAHLTLSFLKEYCDTTDTDKFSEQLAEMSASILQTQKDCNDQNIIYISVLEDESGEISPEELKTLKDALKLIRIKNFLLFEGGSTQETYASFRQSIAKEPSLNSNQKSMQATLTDAYKIYQILKDVTDVENIYLFDTERNEAFACALHTTPTLESKKFFLNFDLVNPLPFGVSVYVPVQPKGVSEEQKISSPNFPKQKILPEPFLPQALLENNPMDRKDSTKKDLDYSDYWTQTNSPREDYQKPNQSYDEILLNMSSDQVLQRRNAGFMKNQQQYSYLNQGNSQRRQSILIDQPLKSAELGGSLKLSHITQQELRKFANKGDLLVIREDLVNNLTKALQAAKVTFNVDDLLKQADDAKITHTTIRKFLETKPISYIGILLDWLSVESLVWIVKSIKNDMMTPSEKLILSRVKECYGLKIEQNFWKSIINYILSNQNQKSNKANSYDQTSAFPLYANKILDPVTNTDTFVIYLTHDAWTPEDQGTVDENSEEWKGFLTFIGNFFREDENSIDQKNNYNVRVATQESDSQDQSKRATWSSSVENVLNRSTNKKDKSLKISEDVKAIPGGRYGCAQFIKICGPSVLKKLSIGRLTLFVQEAINKGILRYQRTLLVKNNPNDSINTLTEVDGVNNSFTQDPAAERKSKLIKTLKEVLIEILSETPEGIPLAQIPLHLKRKMDYVVNFQDLGFPKLKNFLATLPDLVKIESSGTNHAFVKLNNPPPANSRKNLAFKDQVFLPEEQNSMRQQYSAVNQSSSMFQNNNNMTAPGFVNYDQANKMASKKNTNLAGPLEKNVNKPRRNLSSMDDYLNKVRGIIELILTENCYGISMQKLYKELSTKLGCEFDVRLFHCKDFYDFLTNHVENLLDIEIKRNCLIIYPKNFRFGPQTLVNVVNTDQQRASIKASDFGEPGPDSKRGYNQYPPTTSPFNSNKGFSEFEAPPGLAKSSSFKPAVPSGYNMPYNPVGFQNNFPQGRSNMKGTDTGNTPNLSTISPVGFYINDNDEGASERYMQTPSQSVSYWKVADFIGSHINIEEGRQGMTSRSQINGEKGLHSRNDSRVRTQVQEESNLDICENLKFIEELLQDNDCEKSMMTNFTLDRTNESSFGGIQSPNLSFMGLTAIGPIGHVNQTSKQNHSKTQSEDFSTKNILKFSVGGHGRVCSVIPDRKNE